jgi:hypothetical protein
MVHTGGGWRERRRAVFAKRGRGRPAAPDAWDRRRPPAPHARLLFGAIEAAERFGPRRRRWAGRPGVKEAAEVTALADGADWVRNQAHQQLPGARRRRDVHHAAEHLAGCAKALYGEGAAEAVAGGDRPAQEADGGAPAGAAGQPHGHAVRHAARRRLGRLLGASTQRTPRIRARTPNRRFADFVD